MKLKEHVDMAAFLDATAKCAGDVFFHSADGDILRSEERRVGKEC